MRNWIKLFFISSLLSVTAHAEQQLPKLHAEQVSLSGLSSGGFMAAQLHVIYSSQFVGVGVIAGGPYHCAGMDALVADVITAQSRCMNPCGLWLWPFSLACERIFLPDGESLAEEAQEFSQEQLIDDVDQLQNQQVYLFSGGEDETVVSGVTESIEHFYQALGLPDDQIHFRQLENAAHAFISNASDRSCGSEGAPFINNCDYNQAFDLLQTLYGPLQSEGSTGTGSLLEFNQTEFLGSEEFAASGLADSGWIFIPQACQQKRCKLHLAFHGCRQSAAEQDQNSLLFYQASGYNTVAENNDIIIIYPQIRAMDTMDS
ncbi:MAG: hypothetical protein OQK12_02945, partial [Motiliproteus sp.]|nr:hypothetical protein [Motiliproteus sp.]